jgi:hypothetical protein
LTVRRAAPRRKASAVSALTLTEKGELLDELLTARPELREQAEALAGRRLVDADRSAVADDVESSLRYHDVDELNGRAGYQSDRGYVGPGEAADEILDEALQPFLDDLTRRRELGMTTATTELAMGILCGLYACREAGSESLLEYSPDYAGERAADVASRCAEMGVELPVDDLLDAVPEWSRLVLPSAPRPGSGDRGGERQAGARVGPAPRTGRSKR